MPEGVDRLSTPHSEGKPKEYTPWDDPLMHPVIVQDELEPGRNVRLGGYKTDILGTKINLEALGEHNKIRRRERPTSSGRYENIYFTTHSGTIYKARNLEDGSWKVQGTRGEAPIQITQPCTLEVGKRFISPNLVGGIPDLNTSPVQDITLVDDVTSYKGFKSGVSTDIAKKFRQMLRERQQGQ